MKWYSVKKYKPPTSSNLFLRIEKKDSELNLYERYLVGSLECFTCFECNITNPNDWEIANSKSYDFNFNDYTVTHFAIIEPVEIEE